MSPELIGMKHKQPPPTCWFRTFAIRRRCRLLRSCSECITAPLLERQGFGAAARSSAMRILVVQDRPFHMEGQSAWICSSMSGYIEFRFWRSGPTCGGRELVMVGRRGDAL